MITSRKTEKSKQRHGAQMQGEAKTLQGTEMGWRWAAVGDEAAGRTGLIVEKLPCRGGGAAIGTWKETKDHSSIRKESRTEAIKRPGSHTGEPGLSPR